MNFFSKLCFVVVNKITRKSRVSLSTVIKGHKNMRIGRRCHVDHFAILDASGAGTIELGDRSGVGKFTTLAAGSGAISIGKYVEINNYCHIVGSGKVFIGDRTKFGPGVRIISYQHAFSGHRPIAEQQTVKNPIHIGQDAWLGANVVVMAGVTIGEGAVVGAGAVVANDIPDWAVAVGVPAKVKYLREAKE